MDILSNLLRFLPPIIVIAAKELGGQNSSLLAVVGTLLGIGIGSISTFLATWLTLRNQVLLQKVEVRAQMELKARELLFGAYQRKIEASEKSLEDTGASLGKIEVSIEHLRTDAEKGAAIKPLVGGLAEMLSLYKRHVGQIETELKEAKLFDQSEELLGKIKEVLALDFAALTDEEIGQNYRKLLMFSGLISSLEYDLLNHKAEELFNPFINAS
jgi:hypothetical protein